LHVGDLPPGSVTALVCRHRARAENIWTDNAFGGIHVELIKAVS
jgi:hypothetical protein